MSDQGRTQDGPPSPRESSESALERMFFEEYLRERGHTLQSVSALAEEEGKLLLAEASAYASGRLAQVEARARFVQVIHGDPKPPA
jgi:hypothetical protein